MICKGSKKTGSNSNKITKKEKCTFFVHTRVQEYWIRMFTFVANSTKWIREGGPARNCWKG
jgi:hypothetical protein